MPNGNFNGQAAVIALSGGPAPAALKWAESVAHACFARNIRVAVLRHGLRHTISDRAHFEQALTWLAEGQQWPRHCLTFGREGPGDDVELAKKALRLGSELGISAWFLFGGEGTLGTAIVMEQAARALEGELGRIRIALGPKSIDRDLSLPHPTIGFATAAESLAELVTRAGTDADNADDRWYIVNVQGRDVGHLAKEAAFLTRGVPIVLEQFPKDKWEKGVPFDLIRDIILGCILKGLSLGAPNPREREFSGHVVVSEGLPGRLVLESIPGYGEIPYDKRGRPNWAKFDFARRLVDAVNAELAALQVMSRLDGDIVSAVGMTLGYTARAVPANAEDVRLATTLGTASVFQVFNENRSGIVTVLEGDRVQAWDLTRLVDHSGRIVPLGVDVHGDSYLTQWDSLSELRLLQSDLDDGARFAELLRLTGLVDEVFRQRFAPVVAWGRVDN